MLFLFLSIILLALFRLHYCRIGFHDNYLDKEQCSSIKGIFILIVFLRHILPYIQNAGYTMSSLPDQIFFFINQHIGQLLVAMFLFYSGYGVTESIKKKGQTYINSFPKRRILTTLINFDVAVLFFLFINILLGIKMSASQIALSFTCWESIGNSNWYIFVVILCYFITYISYVISKKHFVLITMVFSVISVLALFYFKPTHWYDTLLCYPAGMMWSAKKENIDLFVKKHYLAVLTSLLAIFVMLHIHFLPYAHGLTYNMESIFFSIIIVLITMKARISNSILTWLGIHLFPLYIYQRIPMIVFSKLFCGILPSTYPYLYLVICMGITYIIAQNYKHWSLSLR